MLDDELGSGMEAREGGQLDERVEAVQPQRRRRRGVEGNVSRPHRARVGVGWAGPVRALGLLEHVAEQSAGSALQLGELAPGLAGLG